MVLPAIDDAELTALLGLCLSYDSYRGRLAAELLEHGSARALMTQQPWGSRAIDELEVARVRFVLRSSCLTVLPVWQWPQSLLRAQPLAPALFVRGDVKIVFADAVAIVGARAAHASAERWAYELARRSARHGDIVVSGGARGIDAAAHRGALDGGGRTLAYLGVSADRVYPSHNRALFLRILQSGGALASEYLPLEQTFSAGHALRNRFIAAHASRLFVAEADTDSGSLGTADLARRMRVPVYISPPSIGVRRGGLDALLARGAAEVAT